MSSIQALIKGVNSPVIFVNDIEVHSKLFSYLFQAQEISCSNVPIKYLTLAFPGDTCKIVVIDKTSCPKSLFGFIAAVSVSQLFISVKDPLVVQNLVTQRQCGAYVLESNINESGNVVCVLEGPDQLIIHVLSDETCSTMKSHEIILHAINSKLENEIDPPSNSNIRSSRISETSSAMKTQAKKTKLKANANPRPIIPTLKVEILSDCSQNYVPCPPNSRQPIPFETEMFKGVVNFMLRTDPIDSELKHIFTGNKRTFELQVQGKFKRYPIGELFAGGESSQKLEMGLITKGISKVLMQFLSTLVADLHYSFGDVASTKNFQFPHSTAPAFSAIDKIIVTLPGETPPALGVSFTEDIEKRRLRAKIRCMSDANIDINNVYSFGVSSSQVDLVNWKIVNVPMVRPIDLGAFFGDASIAFVMYEIPKTVVEELPNLHPQKSLNYIFSLRLTRIDSGAAEMLDLNSGNDDDDDDVDDEDNDEDNDVIMQRSRVNTFETDLGDLVPLAAATTSTTDHDGSSSPFGSPINPKGTYFQQGMEYRDEGEDDFSPDEDEKVLMSKEGSSSSKRTMKNWFRKQVVGINPDVVNVVETSDFCPVDMAMEAGGDLRFCPACIETTDVRHKYLYALPVQDGTGTSTCTTLRLWPYADIFRAFSMADVLLPKLHKNKKLVIEERRRRQIVEAYRQYLSTVTLTGNSSTYTGTVSSGTSTGGAANTQQITSFLAQTSKYESKFLSKPLNVVHTYEKGSTKANNGHGTQRWEGCVALARCSRMWEEKHLVLVFEKGDSSKSVLAILKHSGSKLNTVRIPLSSVIAVREMRPEEVPMVQYSYFQVETFARVYYILVKSEHALKDWLAAFQTALGCELVQAANSTSVLIVPTGTVHVPTPVLSLVASIQIQTSGPAASLSASEALEDSYFAKPREWKLDRRRVFNYRSILFSHKGLPEKYRTITCNELAEEILRKAFVLSEEAAGAGVEASVSGSNQNQNLWIQFFDEISYLQTFDFSKLTEKERMAAFLNIYHTMYLHGSLVLGPPIWGNWQSFFNTVTYILGYDILSLAELEHNVLRAAMCKSAMLSVKTMAPQTLFPSLAIKQRDFRLNFCINNGSSSMTSCVPVYTVDNLDRQLDEMTTLMLSETIEIDPRKRLVILPKICSAYLHDFSTRRSNISPNVSPADCLRVIASYVPGGDRQVLVRILSEGMTPSIKFKQFLFSSRKFKLYRGQRHMSDDEMPENVETDE